ncbi:MAG TPA: polysaccharide deacetylase family protein [Acidimicrobiales bacterium]
MMRSSPAAPDGAPLVSVGRRAARRMQRVASDRLKRAVKLLISAMLYGIDSIVAVAVPSRQRGRRSRGVVLMYHDVLERDRARFAAQCDELVRLARPSRLDAMHDAADTTWRAAVTFDDGFRSFARVALPELELRAIPSTLFVATEWARRASGEQSTGEPPTLSPAELAQLPPSVEIGSHSRTHAHLPQLDDASLLDELEGSRRELEEMIGRQVRVHAFPYGEHDRRVVEAARRAGYERVYGIVPTETSPSDGYVVGRVQVDPSDWRIEFKLKVLGAYRWMAWWMLAKHRVRSLTRDNANATEHLATGRTSTGDTSNGAAA